MEQEQERQKNSLLTGGLEFIRKNPLVVGLIAVGVLLLIIGFFQYLNSKKTKDEAVFIPSNAKAVAGAISATEISIDIEGAVQKPGVYKLSEGARVQDALVASGGMSSGADREYVSKHFNLAQKLIDGAKVYIPQKGELVNTDLSVPENSASKTVSSVAIGDNTGLININSATVNQLDTLPKIGPVTAQKIVSARPYASKEELVSKKILSQKTFDGLKDKIIAN